MATVMNIAPGRFCWVELGTTDQAAAKAFYGGLFGWTPEDRPMGPDSVYTMLKHGDRDAGALYALGPEQKGAPPHWMVYVAVASVDEAALKAQSLGATTVAPPFDVMDVGRMAVFQDPTGAHFSVWEARRHKGLGVVDEPGAFCWGELQTKDPAKAERFYTGLFGWGTKPDPKSGYTEWTLGGQSIGGMIQIAPEWGEVPPHWSIYFQVSDCDQTVGKARGLGGKTVMEPRDLPGVGRFSMLSDPQGAHFSIVALTGPGH
jgi:predicted enzyme related to lactoylglutathione lyase